MFVVALVLSAVLIVIDQVLKIAVNSRIDLHEVIEVIKIGSVKIFSLTHIRNTGAAWSIMAGKTWFLVLLPLVVCGLGIFYMYKIRNDSKLEIISLAMIIAGGAGNLIDRVRLKEVIDYIKFEPINFPVFNFADICIVIGAVLFCVSIIIGDHKQSKEKELDSKSQQNKEVEKCQDDLLDRDLNEYGSEPDAIDGSEEQPEKKRLNKKIVIIAAVAVAVIITAVVLWLKFGRKKT
ncbi:MAG: signal peptidase II [Ruminococcus sp.]|nr:signal peptidase II [Ruminococcus sp.]